MYTINTKAVNGNPIFKITTDIHMYVCKSSNNYCAFLYDLLFILTRVNMIRYKAIIRYLEC